MKREEGASPAVAAFSSVSDVLGGFSMTLVVLALSPQVISSDIGKDWIIGNSVEWLQTRTSVLETSKISLCVEKSCKTPKVGNEINL